MVSFEKWKEVEDIGLRVVAVGIEWRIKGVEFIVCF